MTIESEITKLNTNLTNSYTACSNKGATMPANQNFDNLATCVSSIPTATEPTLASLTVTPSTTAQTITPPSGTDGYNTVNVSAVTASIDNNITAGNIKDGVSILGVTGTYEGGGGVGITREVSANGVYQMPTSSFTFSLPSTATKIGSNAMYQAFYNCTGITSVDLSSLITLSETYAVYRAFYGCTNLTNADLSSLTIVSGNNALSGTFYGCAKLASIDLSSLKTVSGSQAMSTMCQDCIKLASIDLSSLKTIGANNSNGGYGQFSNCFSGCNLLTSLTFPKLEKIYCTGGSTTTYGTFANSNRVQKMYFPKLNTITYGSGASAVSQKACTYVFYGCSALTELHFAAANQSAIQATAGYSTAWGRGAGNVTIYFDL